MKIEKKLGIVIPLYKSEPSTYDIASLRQMLHVLHTHEFVFICENNFGFEQYLKLLPSDTLYSFVFFPKEFFSSTRGYNKLMLNHSFYEKFIKFEYILISQLDVWVFKNDMLDWCNKGYDYVGAPWINWEWSNYYASHLTFPRRVAHKLGYKKFNMVGNGGFSLRKVNSCIKNLKRFYKAANDFQQNEDYFFSFDITSYNPFFKIPSVNEALKFAFDENPAEAFKLNNNQLPMACHAWPKYKDFWKDYILL